MDDLSCHSSILEDEDNWSRPRSSPAGCSTTLPTFPGVNSPSTAGFFNTKIEALATNADMDSWRDAWLSTPYQSMGQTLNSDKIFADHIPDGGTSTSSGVISPSHLVQQHHQCPHQTCLHLPRLQYPGTIVAVSCFTHLQHLAIGCIGFQADCSVTDYDIAVVVDTLGQQLQSIRLLKLNGISTASLAMITANCAQLLVLVVFGCEGMRTKERNSRNIQRAFEPFEKKGSCFPRVIVPLSADSLPIEDYIFSQDTGEVNTRKLDLLDLRYSIDLNDEILLEIMNQFKKISWCVL